MTTTKRSPLRATGYGATARISETLGRRLSEIERRLSDAVFKSVPERIAGTLATLAGAHSRIPGSLALAWPRADVESALLGQPLPGEVDGLGQQCLPQVPVDGRDRHPLTEDLAGRGEC